MSVRKYFSSFAALNLTQLSSALNDNLFKLLLVFFLIDLKGVEHANTILAMAGAIYVIPFILLANLAGTLADRFSKRSIIYVTRVIEIISTVLGVLAFALHSELGAYLVLLMMAVHSSLFSPCKYGIIPEIVQKDRISHCNGVITASTYLSIIMGTFFAAFFTDITDKNFVLASLSCVLIGLVGGAASLFIERTHPQAAHKKVTFRFISGIIKTLRQAKRQRYLFIALLFGAYFLFMGAYVQLNIIPFTIQSLGLTDIEGGYLFLMTAIGIGLGSFLAGRFSGKQVELGFVPVAAVGVTLCFVLLKIFATHLFAVVPILVFVGLFGGFYVVPIDSFIQVSSLDRDRGQNVAAGNFLSFVGIVIASGLIALFGNVFNLKASTGFLIVGLFTILIATALFYFFWDQFLRLFASTLAILFWDIKITGSKKLVTPSILLAHKHSWLDHLVIMAILPRRVPHLRIEEISKDLFEIKKEIQQGRSICVVCPPKTTLKTSYPIVTLNVVCKKLPGKPSRWSEFKSLFRYPIKVRYAIDSHD